MEHWHSIFLELMFGKNRTPETMSKAAEIKYLNMPEALFKFRCFSERTISPRKNDCLFSSSADYLNDIREAPIMMLSDQLKQRALQKAYDNTRKNNPRLSEVKIKDVYDLAAQFHSLHVKEYGDQSFPFPTPGADVVIDTIVEYVNDTSNELLARELHNIRNMYNVCCFSTSRDEDLMWSHYADGHKGFCIEYDFKSLGVLDERVQLLFPVIYQDLPSIEIDDPKDADESLAMFALTLKEKKWEYEQEWRSFYLHSETPKPEPMPKPEAIYLGVRCGDKDRDQMIEVCREKNIHLFQMYSTNMFSTLNTVSIL